MLSLATGFLNPSIKGKGKGKRKGEGKEKGNGNGNGKREKGKEGEWKKTSKFLSRKIPDRKIPIDLANPANPANPIGPD